MSTPSHIGASSQELAILVRRELAAVVAAVKDAARPIVDVGLNAAHLVGTTLRRVWTPIYSILRRAWSRFERLSVV
ncbi:hypothetical protein MRB53_038248 [Persea americana]|nr:hypothetical protein MRB53_038248 [Persea americana]